MFKKLVRAFKRPRDPAGYVYYAKLVAPQGVFYKIGFTKKKTLVERFAFGGFGDEKLLQKQILFTFHSRGWDAEQDLLDHFGRLRAFGKYSNKPDQPLPGRGQSELFFVDVLGLDSDLYGLSARDREQIHSQAAEVASGCLLAAVLAPFTMILAVFFALATVVSLFQENKRPITVPRRPRHPEKIQQILDDLAAESSNCTLQRTASGSR
ncbi:MAG: hypothetical protein KF796_06880 [Ramlibacter sp.]|nr:hypothetical protein [Ramlibacter sp.]